MPVKIVLGCDHAGYDLKEAVAAHLRALGHEVQDVGTHGREAVDYPEYAVEVARRVAGTEADRGVLICGSGIGMSMVANRIAGVRAAMVSDPEAARMSRRHNDSNILCLGARFLSPEQAVAVLDVWLEEAFEGGRHQRRLDLIDRLTRVDS
jgi:ribose 5-phosphate isomerase B